MSIGSDIEFIQRVREFGERELDLDFKGSFQFFDSKAKLPNWLYVSPVDRIESALRKDGKPVPFHFSWSKEELENEEKKYISRGLDTYLFTAEAHGGGNCPITQELLRAEKARRCYVILHEGWHSTIAKEGIRMPYEIEEATGRVVGNFGAILFAKREEDPEFIAQAVAQENDWARFAGFVNRWYTRLTLLYCNVAERVRKRAGDDAGFRLRAMIREKILEVRESVLKKIMRRAKELASRMSSAQEIKELGKVINNAFILRYYSYTKYYLLAVRTLKESKNLAAACVRFKGSKPIAEVSK